MRKGVVRGGWWVVIGGVVERDDVVWVVGVDRWVPLVEGEPEKGTVVWDFLAGCPGLEQMEEFYDSQATHTV